MILGPENVQQLLENPANGEAISACLRHEQRLQLHAVPHIDTSRRPAGWLYLREWARSMMPLDEAIRWEQCVPAPLPTTDVVEDIFTGLQRVFEAQDGLIQCELATAELETDFEQYRTAQREAAFWQGPAFQAVGRRPHSLLVIDMASEQRTPRPEPYSLLIELEQVWDVALREDGSCEYVMFSLPDGREGDVRIERVAVYDDAAYMIWRRPEGTQQWSEELNNPHILGYCPARLLWNRPLDKATDLPRLAPLTGVLAGLDRYVFWDAAIEYARLHGTFPITWGFEEQCTFQGAEGEQCQSGIITYIKSYETLSSGEQRPNYSEKPCPACAKRPKIGPGTYVTVPAPSKDMPDTRDPIGRVNPEVPVLEHFREIQQQRRQDLLRAVLGGGGEPENEQAKNQKQVQSGFEIKQDVLVEFKKPLEEARAWELTTKGRLRYGSLYRGTFVSYGERFYLKTPEQLAKEEEEARKAGRPVYELSQARDFRYQTQHRNNPVMLDRMRILSDLEPYPEYSVEQILNLLASFAGGTSTALELFDNSLLRLKVDFGRYLTRFESEQLDVVRFASLQPYHIKIALITQILLSYVPDSPQNGDGQNRPAPEARPENAPVPAA
ncbi:hypothetical protein [Hymenobacter sediminicola]|uniref:Phage portal protein n=1 Tax=Hymenobacter sediminicola TaxID=2761579 RepID=A0A7G7W2Z6_9BACT|nr:hypothetical protein [Hymenobacter sediminicola]QNH60739.1 hypothetical protein H4317_11105 [Hymenobacter sediminicola]